MLELVLKCLSPLGLSWLQLSSRFLLAIFHPSLILNLCVPCDRPLTSTYIMVFLVFSYPSCETVHSYRADTMLSSAQTHLQQRPEPWPFLNLICGSTSPVRGGSSLPTTFLLQALLKVVENPQSHMSSLRPVSSPGSDPSGISSADSTQEIPWGLCPLPPVCVPLPNVSCSVYRGRSRMWAESSKP